MYQVYFINITDGELTYKETEKVKTLRDFWKDSIHTRKECFHVTELPFHKYNLIVGNTYNGLGYAFTKI